MSSWTDIFRFRSPRSRTDQRVRWLGKLPIYADYCRSDTEGAWTGEFEDWVLKGYARYEGACQQAGSKLRRLPVTGLIIRLPQSQMTVIGSILDFGGDMAGRHFPMCFYAGLPTGPWPGPSSDTVTGALRAIRDLIALRGEVVHACNSPGAYKQLMHGRELDLGEIGQEAVDEVWLEPARKVNLDDWWEGAKQVLTAGSLDAWLHAVEDWGDQLAERDDPTFKPTLRFPLAAGPAYDLQVAGWIRWLESRIDLRRRFASLIVTGEPNREAGWLSVILRDPLPDDFLLSTPLASTLTYVDDATTLKMASPALEKEREAATEPGDAPPPEGTKPTKAQEDTPCVAESSEVTCSTRPDEAESPPHESVAPRTPDDQESAPPDWPLFSNGQQQTWADFVAGSVRVP